MNIENLSVSELIELGTKIAKLITVKQEDRKIKLREEFKKMGLDAGLSLDEVLAEPVKKKTKALPKYKNPDSNQTWSGRGARPKWFKDQLETGTSEKDMLIS